VEKQSLNGVCHGSCQTRFRICLKQYQAEVDATSECTFGAVATKVLGDNSFNLTQSSLATKNQPQEDASNPISFSFIFTWPVSTFFFLLFYFFKPKIPLFFCFHDIHCGCVSCASSFLFLLKIPLNLIFFI
jgi:hypothetical protein